MKVFYKFEEYWPIAELHRDMSTCYNVDGSIIIEEAVYNEFTAAEKAYFEAQKRIKAIIKEQKK